MQPVRTITSATSLENLRREAKRWLQALRANDAEARARFERARPGGPQSPTLRDVQLALAREYGFNGWHELKERLSSAPRQPAELDALLAEADRGNDGEVARIVDAHPGLVNVRGTLAGHTGLRTALHFGVKHLAVVRALLERGADPNIRDEGDDATPLHFAAERGNIEIVRALVEHGADTVGDGTFHELNVLGWAVCWANVHHAEVAEYLLAHGAQHTIHTAVALGDTDAIRRIVARAPDDIGKVMDGVNRRRTPLHLAVVKQQLGSLDTLLALGADPNAGDVVGLTALDQAALDGQTEYAEVLIAHGARIGLPAAVALGREADVARLLHDDPGALRPGGRWDRLIIHAASHCSGAVMEALIRGGASVGVIDEPETAIDGTRNYTALHAAAFHGNVDAVRVLLAHGSDVRIRDSNYRGTPAGWANYAGKDEARDLILEGDIDIFDAIDMKPERIPDVVARDRGALRRPVGDYPGGGAWEELPATTTPLQWAEHTGNETAARILRTLGAGSDARPVTADVVEWFLENACPDHHVRGGPDHAMAAATAVRIFEQHPGLPGFEFVTAVVSADTTETARILADSPEQARVRRLVQGGGDRQGVGGSGDRFRRKLGPKDWEPLLFLAFTRLPIPAVEENAVAIARMLLDAGADPNAYFMAGDSRYTPLVGVIGRGEESRPPHPQRDALARLLLERGAEPYDQQVVYNLGWTSDALWFLKLIHEFSVKAGRGADWEDPEWSMLDMGGYGSGARWHFERAIRDNDLELAEWMLAHGANPRAAAPRDRHSPQHDLIDGALELGRFDIVELFVRHGVPRPPKVDDAAAGFREACFRLDADEVRRRAAAHPELLRDTRVVFDAIKRDRDDVLRLLLDAGMSPDIEDHEKQRPLHMAAYDDAIRCGTLLVERGAEIDPMESNYENTPIDAAVYSQSHRMIELLSRHSRNVWNLVFVGASDRLRELVTEDPALARKVSEDGWTPLMWLPDDPERAMEIVDLFLAHGADPARVNSEGLTAADYAEKRALAVVAERLRHAAIGT